MTQVPDFNANVDVNTIKGFLDHTEGLALYRFAYETSSLGPCLEVGSYCGKSTVYLGQACQLRDNQLFAIDHHRGSEEHQLGEEYHDADLFDPSCQRMDSFKAFRSTLMQADLESTVVPVVASSVQAARFWQIPLSMVFIDGGHSLETAMIDYRAWVSHIVPGGILAIHDLFPDPTTGGQAPITIYRLAKASGLFTELPTVKTLGLLRRI